MYGGRDPHDRDADRTHQLHCRGINLSDFYVNSIHFIYSTITEGERGSEYTKGHIFCAMFSTRLFVVCAQIFAKLICNFSGTVWLCLSLLHRHRLRIRFQQISCGAHKLCANKLLFVKWLCIRRSTRRLFRPHGMSVCLSVCRSVCPGIIRSHMNM